MLSGVTLTGADDSVSPLDLIQLSKDFPFVEWGILIGSHGGTTRFPSAKWFRQLHEACEAEHPFHVNLSLHLCGSVLRSLLAGESPTFADEVEPAEFSRCQLNFHGERVSPEWAANLVDARGSLPIPSTIIQLDGVNDWIVEEFQDRDLHVSGLYDQSHGAGVKPDQWPFPNPRWSIGYAGGLGPGNVAREVVAMKAIACGQDFWIDMETKLYTGDRFDLGKCRQVLEAMASEFDR